MSLPAGTRLGPYDILGLIGVGGMGAVYKARDTRLDRTVALKILPPEVAADPDRRLRFEREAHAIAALSHPNICTLHDIGTETGTTYLVMEHLVGETLAERLAKGPLPLVQVLDLGAQIAEGLAAAHKAGIVHRDLKPANVMLVRGPTASGPPAVKLLDFGLAKLTGHGEAPAATLATTAVVPASLTGRGTIVGTLPYMAPEQVQGQEADARTDIWALGTILYEMITGTRAFEASSAVSLIGAILERDPPSLAAREPLTPPGLERIVRRCLAKHSDDRWDSAHDVADELRWIAETSKQTSSVERERSWRRTALRVVFPSVVIAGVIGGLVVWAVRPSPPTPILWAHLGVQPADDVYSSGVKEVALWTRGGSRTALAWAPDGRTLVFVGRRNGLRQLYLRDLVHPEARPLAGTEGAQVLAVSPDGQSVVFWANGEIARVPLGRGPLQTLATAVPFPPHGMAVGVTDRVVYGRDEGALWAVNGGAHPTAVTSLAKGEVQHASPQLLANDTVVLFTVRAAFRTWGNERIVAQVLATGERRLLLQDAADARYVPTGHLVFLRRGLLMAVPFDTARLAVTGPPVAVLEGVAQALTSGESRDSTGAGQFSVSAVGTLAYIPSRVVPTPDSALVAVDRQGRVSVLPVEARSYHPTLGLSPDGHRVVIPIRSLTEESLWIADLSRGSLTKLTPAGEAEDPRWTPNAQHVAFTWLHDGLYQLAWQGSDGSGPPATLADGRGSASSWSPDGQHLAVTKDNDIWVLTVATDPPTLTRVTDTPEEERAPAFSPDGRSMAYASNKTGRFEVYVRPRSGPGPSVQISIAGGSDPAWNPKGGELFFLAPASDTTGQYHMMAVALAGQRPGTPRPLFTFRAADLYAQCVPTNCYAVMPDGQHFVVTKVLPRDRPPPVTHINLVLNWVEELKQKVPVTRGR